MLCSRSSKPRIEQRCRRTRRKILWKSICKKASSTNSSTDEAIPLTYVPYEEMTGGKAKIDEPIANEQLQNGKDITECFSVSPEGKLVIANKVVNTDNNGNKTTSISLKELEYKSKITKYITPLNF